MWRSSRSKPRAVLWGSTLDCAATQPIALPPPKPQVGGNSSSGGPATPDPAPTPSLTLGSILPAGIDAGKLAAVNLHGSFAIPSDHA